MSNLKLYIPSNAVGLKIISLVIASKLREMLSTFDPVPYLTKAKCKSVYIFLSKATSLSYSLGGYQIKKKKKKLALILFLSKQQSIKSLGNVT